MYIYKKYDQLDYDRLHDKWLASEPKLDEELPEADDPRFDEVLSRLLTLRESKEYRAWLKREPHFSMEMVKPVPPFHVDVLRGWCPTKLLFRQEFNKKFPHKPLQDLMASQKRRHKNWGPYDHKLRINIYADSQPGGLRQLEVDLWQDIPTVEDVNAVVEQVRMGKLQPKIFRY